MTREELKIHCENQINLCSKLNDYKHLEEHQLILNLIKESQELKKQLENKYEKVGTLTAELLYEKNTKLINQQKEFIKYLEDEIKLYENDIQNFKKDYKVYFSLINDLRVSEAKIEEILQKYKEIIGDDK